MIPTIKLPIWFDGAEVGKLRAAALAWWTRLGEWVRWPLSQLDPTTCTVRMLNLIAWQRDIDRFDGEPLSLFRLRVKHAYANAVDSGSVAGFKRILQRLGVGYVDVEERMDGVDWDVVALHISDSQLSKNQVLLNIIIRQYGRTCRRYQWTVLDAETVGIHGHEFCNDYQLITAKL